MGLMPLKVERRLVAGYQESTPRWSSLLRGLKERGMNSLLLVIGDGHLGIWGALRQVWPEADEQRCWNHRILNILDKLSKRRQPQERIILKTMAYFETLQEAEYLKRVFQAWCRKHDCDQAAGLIDRS